MSEQAVLPQEAALDPARRSSTSRRGRRSYLPRVSLRSLLLFAAVFCLLCGWLGRNYAHMRQQDAALETLKRAEASIVRYGDERLSSQEEDKADKSWAGPLGTFRRLIGWDSQPGLQSVLLISGSPDNPTVMPALDKLSQFPEIESVFLAGPGFSDSSLVPLKRLPRLQTLVLWNAATTGAGVAELRSLRQVNIANMSGKIQPEELIEGLASMNDLRELSLHGIALSRDDVETLASMPELESLSLSHVVLDDDDSCAPLAQAKSLRSLKLLNSADDADMTAIAELRELRQLSVVGISDAGLDRLAPLTGLDRAEFWHPVTREAVRRYSAARPECLIRYDDVAGKRRFYRWSEPVAEEALPPEDQFGYGKCG